MNNSERQKRYREMYPDRAKGYSQRYRDNNYSKVMLIRTFNSSKKRATSQGIPYSIVLDDLKALWEESGNCCALSGLTFQEPAIPGQPHMFSPSLDRIRPELGYVPGNIRFILNGLNALKGTNTDAELKMVCAAVTAMEQRK